MARCYCPSVGEGRVRMTTHLAGCRFLEDLVNGSGCDHDDPPYLAREPGPDEQALAGTYHRHEADLAALDAAYADRSWMDDL
jgi:hypothetical protein